MAKPKTTWKRRYEILSDACKGVPETLRQSAYLLDDDDIDGECADVREMARNLERALAEKVCDACIDSGAGMTGQSKKCPTHSGTDSNG